MDHGGHTTVDGGYINRVGARDHNASKNIVESKISSSYKATEFGGRSGRDFYPSSYSELYAILILFLGVSSFHCFKFNTKVSKSGY